MSLLFLLLLAFALSCQTDVELIKKHEGLSLCVYTDSVGLPTVCYGFNLKKSGAASGIASVGGDFTKLTNSKLPKSERCLTQTQCDKLLTPDVESARRDAVSVFGSHCSCVQAVLTDFLYNVGKGTAEQFLKVKSQLKQKNYAGAAKELESSTWCKQVKTRCVENVSIVTKGCAARKNSPFL